MPTTTKPDEADIIAQHAQLTADLTAARQNITTLTADVTRLNGELSAANTGFETARESLKTLTLERDSLKSENERLKSESKTFEARLASELAKHGIAPTAAAADPKKTGDGKPSNDDLMAQYKAVQNDPLKLANFLQANDAKIRALLASQ